MKPNLLVAFALAALGCSNQEPGNPPAPPLVIDASVPLVSPPRTVGHRNPLGDVLQADNLMADGDFELTGTNDQAPWYAFDNTGQISLKYDTGGHCRSGVRCGTIAGGQQLVGFMASPAQSDVEIRAYAKPDTGRCADALVVVIDLANQSTQYTIYPVAPTPDEKGWCLFMQSAANLALQQPMLYIQLQSPKAKSLLVDQVSALPVEEIPAHKSSIRPTPPPANVLERIAFVTEWIRTHRIYGRPSPMRGEVRP